MGEIGEIVAGIAAEAVASGAERGLQVAAYVDQQPVVDVVAGLADPDTGRPVEPGTLFYNWSIGKGATATLVHQLVDAGTLRYDTPSPRSGRSSRGTASRRSPCGRCSTTAPAFRGCPQARPSSRSAHGRP